MRVPHIGIRLALEVVLALSYDIRPTPHAVVPVVDALGEDRLEVSLLRATWQGHIWWMRSCSL